MGFILNKIRERKAKKRAAEREAGLPSGPLHKTLALIPFCFFNVLQSDERLLYAQNITNHAILGSLPFILVGALSHDNAYLGCWIAFALQLVFNVLPDLYIWHSGKVPGQDPVFWIPIALMLNFFIQGITYSVIKNEDYLLMFPITNSVLLGAMILSCLVRYPFVWQTVKVKAMAKNPELTNERKQKLMKHSYNMSFIFILAMCVGTACVWIGYFLYGRKGDTSSAGSIVLTNVIPIVMIFIGFISLYLYAKTYMKPKQEISQLQSDVEIGNNPKNATSLNKA